MPMTPEQFAKAGLPKLPSDVSRETLDRLQAYADVLAKWQAKINLVGAATLPDIWQRHFLDSAQLYPFLPPQTRVVCDIGSGAGFPGLVLAIVAEAAGRDIQWHLVESDARKAAFLAEAARVTRIAGAVKIHPVRAEGLAGRMGADVITARAVAPLETLLGYAQPLVKPDGLCLFLKGETVEDELTIARQRWAFLLEKHPSKSDPAGVILAIRGVRLKTG
jgi:16S rRNA (guanine527-N7)-methyltransferase